MRDGHGDEVGRQRLELLPVGDGFGERRGIGGGDPPGDIGPLAPDLVLEVRAGPDPGRLRPVFGFETALLHGLGGRHLFKNAGALGVELRVHFHYYV